VVDEGSVGFSLREHAITRSWCYSYLNCFQTYILLSEQTGSSLKRNKETN